MRKLQTLSKKDMALVAFLNVPWEAYKVLDDVEKNKFKLRWERMVQHEAAVMSRSIKRQVLPHEFAALISFRISIPSWSMFTLTKLYRFAKEGKLELVPGEIMKFTTIDGVWNDKMEFQRRAEVELFRNGIYPANMPEDVWM